MILDDATTEIYYAQLVEEESTRTVMSALREVIEHKGLFCALYSDRGSHFFVTREAGEKVDPHPLTQVGRAMKELGHMTTAMLSPVTELFGRHNSFLLRRRIAAVQITREGHGRSRCGMCLHLPPGAEVKIFGEGFSAQTVQVRSDGHYYFVLRSTVLP